MAISSKSVGGVRFILLADDVDIAQAAELKQVINEAIKSGSRVSIQVSGATGIGVTAAQLLWAAISSPGTEIVVEGPWSAQVEESFSASGLRPLLQAIVQSSVEEGANVLASRQ
ncbi:hypothetical protein P8935_02230 [Telmatobacter sp. DSM 110680]|uniref:STAS domain-containing protein n=1 Tax=Telmatobacter sp. DSM 110680 TaxID=3036704 RepID=A0AAU7DKA7_9BACT